LIPISAPRQRDGNRSNFIAHGLVRGNEREYFVYATEGYSYEESNALPEWKKKSFVPRMRLRCFTFRVDGFVSVRSRPDGGTIVTKQFVLNSSQLELNHIAWPRPAGEIRVGIPDANGEPLKGLTLNDCKPLRGDEIDHPATWQLGLTPGNYAGKPVRLQFQLKHADLFSFRFTVVRITQNGDVEIEGDRSGQRVSRNANSVRNWRLLQIQNQRFGLIL
tara:strand:+ start:1730 stop:2386 length:657 start_codon:yes stop_codon:yes gene_type:complete